tara:strand:+ start:475 stop:585 length:111 start_codon:yes stop_codon:yes gene_type:complete
MEKLTELLPVFGFILSLILLGYGLKKFFYKQEKNKN